MPRRQPKSDVPASPYRYKSIEECESETPDGNHVVSPKAWPPQRVGTTAGEPSVSLQCDLCGGWVIAYAKHATGEMDGVTVHLPAAYLERKAAQEAARDDARKPGRPRKVRKERTEQVA